MKNLFDYRYYFKEFYPLMGYKFVFVLFFSVLSIGIDLLVLSFIIPFVAGIVTGDIEKFLPQKIKEIIIQYGFEYDNLLPLISFLLIIKVLVSISNNIFKAHIVKVATLRLRKQSLKKIYYSEYEKLSNYKPSEIDFAVSSEFQNIGNLIKTFINNLSRGVLFIGYMFLLLYILGFKTVIISFVYSTLFYSLFYFVQKKVKAISKKFSTANSKYLELLNSGLNNIRYIFIKNDQSNYLNKTLKEGAKADKNYYYLRITEGVLVSLREPFVVLLILSVILTSKVLFKVEIDNITLGLAIFWRTYNSFFEFLSSYNNMNMLNGSYHNFKNVVDKLGIKKFNNTDTDEKNIFSLEMIDLSFYRKQVPLFSKINLNLKLGDFLIIKGPSGSGKSTLVNVITGLLKPASGEIKYFDKNLKSIQRDGIKFGFIDQTNVIFNDTLFNNLTLWDIPSKKNIKILTQLAQIFPKQSFLENLNSEINIKKISGGQRQMISIIRELYLDSQILIMDEPTSSIDTINKDLFYHHIKKLKHKIIILITHDESFIFDNTHKIEL